MAKLAPKNAITDYVWSNARLAQKTIVLPEAEDERTLRAAQMVEDAGLGKVILIGKEQEIRQKAKLAPKNAIMEYVWSNARLAQKTIVLPEAEDERTLRAAEMVEDAGLGKVILIGKEQEIREKAKLIGANIDSIQVLDNDKYDRIDEYAEKLLEIRKGKIASIDDARRLLRNKIYFSVMMVRLDDADGMVAGAANTSADIERPAFQILKTAKGISIASTYFAMIVPNCPYGDNGFFLYADAGGNPNPTAEELAEIAITTCTTAKNIFGIENPRAAMLSFSTKGSGSHPLVDKVHRGYQDRQPEAPGPGNRR